MAGPTAADGPDDDAGPDRAAPGRDALQAAAQEMIDATRALLDAAEAVVQDPEMAERLGRVVRSASAAAARAARTPGPTSREEGDDGDGGLERIPVD